MTNDHQLVDEYSLTYRMSIDEVDMKQYIEFDEGVEDIAEDDEYFIRNVIRRRLTMTMMW